MVEEVFNYTNITNLNVNDTDTLNITESDVLRMNQNFIVISVYSVLFVIAAVGNLTVFISLFRSRHRKSRISLMIRHLAIADLIVTFIMIPIEVGWRLTGKWIAGNVACKVFQFLRAFGPYLSSNVLVCVSLDRYFAVLHPLKVNDARRRGKVMLAFAWGTSFIYCIPQSFVFRVIEHPHIPNFLQCVSFEFFQTPAQEIAYNLACVMCMYFIPLFVIIVAYTAIMCEISKNSKATTKDESSRTSNGRMRLRRSDISNIERARARTLRMTVTIVVVYIWCCTPYVIITLWYMFDREGARQLPQWLQDTFFIMVVSNSCMNPIVYGSYVINFRRIRCGCLCSKTDTEFTRNNGETQIAAGRGRSIARGVIKCVLRMQKVGSGATKSTTVHALGNGFGNKRSTIMRAQRDNVSEDHHQIPSSSERSTNNCGHISYFNESRKRCNYRLSFHSEPCTRTKMYQDERHSIEEQLCHSADYSIQFASDVL